jgi:hypothetical protein
MEELQKTQEYAAERERRRVGPGLTILMRIGVPATSIAMQ